jgi:3-methyladenine DNA glycosylase/8-oxoguanine DNA glycosylase
MFVSPYLRISATNDTFASKQNSGHSEQYYLNKEGDKKMATIEIRVKDLTRLDATYSKFHDKQNKKTKITIGLLFFIFLFSCSETKENRANKISKKVTKVIKNAVTPEEIEKINLSNFPEVEKEYQKGNKHISAN